MFRLRDKGNCISCLTHSALIRKTSSFEAQGLHNEDEGRLKDHRLSRLLHIPTSTPLQGRNLASVPRGLGPSAKRSKSRVGSTPTPVWAHVVARKSLLSTVKLPRCGFPIRILRPPSDRANGSGERHRGKAIRTCCPSRVYD